MFFCSGYVLGLVQVFLKKLLRQEGARPEFAFKEGQLPEQARNVNSPHHFAHREYVSCCK